MMTIESSNKLAALIAHIAADVTRDVEKAKGTSYNENSLTFKFDHGGRRPKADDAISALWGRSSVLTRGEYGFYITFYEGSYSALQAYNKPLPDEYVAHYEECKQCAEDSWRVFGDWFGRKWE